MPVLFKASCCLGILRALEATCERFEMQGQAKGCKRSEERERWFSLEGELGVVYFHGRDISQVVSYYKLKT